MSSPVLLYLFLISLLISESLSIWCYRCTSATPGCADNFNWRGIGYLGEQCPNEDDICVKITERRGAKETITRDCLSALDFRKDIPADKYEGCRKAVAHLQLAHYVNHTIKENDVRQDYFTDTEYCFCFLDHRCNGAPTFGTKSVSGILISSILAVLIAKA